MPSTCYVGFSVNGRGIQLRCNLSRTHDVDGMFDDTDSRTHTSPWYLYLLQLWLLLLLLLLLFGITTQKEQFFSLGELAVQTLSPANNLTISLDLLKGNLFYFVPGGKSLLIHRLG